MIARCIVICVVGLAVSTPSQALRVHSYALDVAFEPEDGEMTGHAEVRFEPGGTGVDELEFYLHSELRVTVVEAGDRVLPVRQSQCEYFYNYSLAATKVVVTVTDVDLERGLTVSYSGHFRPSHARSPSDYMRIDEQGVFLRAYQYSLWFPVFLRDRQDPHAVDFDAVKIDTPARYVSVFAGTRIADREIGARRVSEWRALELELNRAQCTARPFSVERDSDCFVYSLSDPDSRGVARQILALAQRLDAIYRSHYRADGAARQIHVLQMPRFGDISSGNVLGLSAENWASFGTGSASALTLAHELVHSFVWVPTPRGDPLFALVVEGFPAYFHLPALGEILGAEFYSDFMARTEERYLNRREAGPDSGLPPEKPLLAITADEVGTYKDRFVLADRALLFLDDLRWQLGAGGFDTFMRELLARESLDLGAFVNLVTRHLPDYRERMRLWLETTDYPDSLRLQSRRRR